MTEEDVRNYEAKMQAETNEKVLGVGEVGCDEEADEAQEAEEDDTALDKQGSNDNVTSRNPPKNPTPVSGGLKSWFTWNWTCKLESLLLKALIDST